MAKRTPLLPQAPQLSPRQIQVAISRFKGLIGDLENFDPKSVQDRRDPRVQVLELSVKEALIDAFGHRTQYQLYASATVIDSAQVNYAYQVPHAEIIAGLVRGKDRAIALLSQAVKSLESRLAEIGVECEAEDARGAPAISRDVFIVHGHDDVAKVEVARLIERAGLNAIILHEQANTSPCSTGRAAWRVRSSASKITVKLRCSHVRYRSLADSVVTRSD